MVTVPIGVLKKETLAFDPPLPERKRKAIAAIGFGTINKCALLFPHQFWGADMGSFGFVNSEPEDRGLHFLIFSYAHVAGAPVLLALSSGAAAKRKPGDTPESIKDQLMARLRRIFGKKEVEVPEPIDCRVTNWENDEFSYGSYSNIVVGASGDVYNLLAEPLRNRVFFAGEGTTRQYLATMHGAVFSGFRAAGTIHTLHAKSKSRQSQRRSPSPATMAPWGRKERGMALVPVGVAECFDKPDLKFDGESLLVKFGREGAGLAGFALALVDREVLDEIAGMGGRGSAGPYLFLVPRDFVRQAFVDSVGGGIYLKVKRLIDFAKAEGFGQGEEAGAGVPPFWSVEGHTSVSDVIHLF